MTNVAHVNSMPELADIDARRRALLEHDRTLLVEAGAGSGKTALLAGRIAMMFASGIAPRDVTAITFTEAAASELRERVTSYVEKLARNDVPREISLVLPDGLSDDQRAAIATARNELDAFTCTTIHGFCQKILAPYPVEAQLDPGATIIEAARNEFVRDDLVTQWLAERFGRPSQRGNNAPAPIEDDIFVALLEAQGLDLVNWLRDAATFLCEHHELRAIRAEDPQPIAQALGEAIQEFADWYNACGITEEKTSGYLRDLLAFRDLLLTQVEQPLTSTQLIAYLRHEHPSPRLSSDANFRLYRCKTNWEKAAVASGRSKPDGTALNMIATQKYEQCAELYPLWCGRIVDAAVERIVREFTSLREAYKEYKRRIAALDFNDLLTHARDLVVRNAQVRQALALRYPRILVDEFQDTDPIQAELLWYLCAESPHTSTPWPELTLRDGSLFIVGDPKQAIYRFRGADITIYLKAKESLCARHDDAVLEIHANFRSDARILDFVNTHFSQLLDAPEQIGYTPLLAALECDTTRQAVVAFDISLDDEHRNANGKLISAQVRRQEARSVAETVAILLSEATFPDRHTRQERPCRPGDIALLSATGTELWIYERELTELGIPIASQAGKGFFHRQEVQDLIALVRALSDQRDTLAFGAFLRGPLLGLTEESIADAVMECHAIEQPLTLWTPPITISHELLRGHLIKLQYLARKARTTTPYQLLAEAMEILDVRALLQLRDGRNSERSLANIDSLLTMSKEYDVRGIAVFARALHERWLDSERFEEGRVDEQQDAVFLSTIHASKGLEWPIVIPINSGTEKKARSDLFLHRRSDATAHFKVLGEASSDFAKVKEAIKQEEQNENIRLWYVALTRARNTLVLPRPNERMDGDQLGMLNLDLDGLSTIEGIAKRYHANPSKQTCAQNLETWERQARDIAALRKTVTMHYPSRADEKIAETSSDDTDFVYFTNEQEIGQPSHDADSASSDARVSIQGGRIRGIVLHKLIEEIITGELTEEQSTVIARAKILLGQLGFSSQNNPNDGVSADELAQCVERTFALPQIKAVRDRLSAEVPVFASKETDRGMSVTSGVIDAIVRAQDGSVEMVIDWKSDVNPDPKIIEHYQAQIREYIHATNAQHGLIVFSTIGITVNLGKGIV